VLVQEGKATLGIDAELREGATISGRVGAGPSNEPLVNADEEVLPSEGQSCVNFPNPIKACDYRYAPTGAGGRYTISGLPRGSYYVEFVPPQGQNLVRQFFEEAYSLRFAKAVPIEEGTKYEINTTLKVGGEISGTVTDAPTHTPLAGVGVFASFEESEPIDLIPFVSGATTNAKGEYTIDGLPTGSFNVGFDAPYPYQYIDQTVKGVAVTQGLTTSGINVALIRNEPVNTEPPLLYGTAYVGHTLSCGNGSWTGLGWTEVSPYAGASPFVYTYTWLRDGGVIGGGTRSTYVVQPRDQGHGLACQVIAANLVSQGVTATSNTLYVPAAPTIQDLKQSHSRWSEGNKLATYSRIQKPPVGTTFSFVLNEQAAVSLAFTQQVSGRKVHGRCVAETNKNRHERGCRRALTRGTLSFAGRGASNKVAFQGRISGSERLPLGAYTLRITARNSGGEPSSTRSLSFTIVR
jgi:hypothetical protein